MKVGRGYWALNLLGRLREEKEFVEFFSCYHGTWDNALCYRKKKLYSITSINFVLSTLKGISSVKIVYMKHVRRKC